MKKVILIAILSTSLFSCKESTSGEDTVIQTVDTTEVSVDTVLVV